VYKNYYSVTAVIKADSQQEAEDVAGNMVAGSAQGVVTHIGLADKEQAFKYDTVRDES
jgi:hypothetical protein